MPKIEDIRKRWEASDEACRDLYGLAEDDRRFVTVPGAQWDNALSATRGERPCYEFPKLAPMIRQIVNTMKQSRPQAKVVGMGEGDSSLAVVIQGMCYSIEELSNAREAYDNAFDSAVTSGFGAWRIRTKWSSEKSFDQDIVIEPIYHPFTVRFDPGAERLDRSDAEFAFVDRVMSREQFDREFPEASAGTLSGVDSVNWCPEGKVRVSEYLYKEYKKSEVWQLEDGTIVDADGQDESRFSIAKRRKTRTHKVFSVLTNGNEELTKPVEIPSKYIPIVPVWGRYRLIDGEPYWQGEVRQNRDMQRLHNTHRTSAIEFAARSPLSPLTAPVEATAGLEDFYRRANVESFPILPFKGGPQNRPERIPPPQMPASLVALAQLEENDMKFSTGQVDAAFGLNGNEVSGVAIQRRMSGVNTATFNYMSNLRQAMRYSYRIIIDMIPRVYDTQRVVRMLGADGTARWIKLNETRMNPQTGQPMLINNVSIGKYDVSVSIGRDYDTAREESADVLTRIAGSIGGAYPPLSALLAYQVMRSIDVEGAPETADAMRKMLVSQGMLPAGPNDKQKQPSPEDVAKMHKLMADVEKAQATTGKIKAQTQKELAGVHKTMLDTELSVPKTEAEIAKDHANVDLLIAEAVNRRLDSMVSAGIIPPIPNSAVSTRQNV